MEWCLPGSWRPDPTSPARRRRPQLRPLFPEQHDPCQTPAGFGRAQAWGWACTAGPAAALTWSFSGGCAYTGSLTSQRGQKILSLGPCGRRGTSWVWLGVQTEAWRGVLHSHHSGTKQIVERRNSKIRVKVRIDQVENKLR